MTARNLKAERAAKRARNAANAKAAHAAAAHRIESLLAEITDGLQSRLTNTEINFGHVGDLQHYEAQLSNVADSLLGRGEYE